MEGTVHYTEDNNIALLKIDNPPVNPLSSGVRQGLYNGVSKALCLLYTSPSPRDS